MSSRQSLVEFQQQLSNRLRDAPGRAAVDALLAVSLGAESWLISLADIAEVVRCPPIESVPWTKPWFRGATNFRGQVCSVVDLACFVGGTPIPEPQGARLLLLNRSVARSCALLVDKVLGMRNPAAFRAAPASNEIKPWIKSRRVDDESAAWHELDVRALMANPDFLDVTA